MAKRVTRRKDDLPAEKQQRVVAGITDEHIAATAEAKTIFDNFVSVVRTRQPTAQPSPPGATRKHEYARSSPLVCVLRSAHCYRRIGSCGSAAGSEIPRTGTNHRHSVIAAVGGDATARYKK